MKKIMKSFENNSPLNLKCFIDGHAWKKIGPDKYICERCGKVKIKNEVRNLKKMK